MTARPITEALTGRRRDSSISPTREIAVTAASLLVSLVAIGLLGLDMLGTGQRLWTAGSTVELIQLVAFSCLVGVLIYGGLVYQATRLGYVRRLKEMAEAAPMAPPSRDPSARHPRVVVLIPSYREEPAVVRRTILSAALQEHPDLSVVLLVDDPPKPGGGADSLLAGARALPAEVDAMLGPTAAMLEDAAAEFAHRLGGGRVASPHEEAGRLAEVYREAAASLEALSSDGEGMVPAHIDALFREQVIERAAGRLRDRAQSTTSDVAPGMSHASIASEYRWLASIFRVHVTSFERKRYANLSHAPNKAMNLNSFISLLGGSWKEQVSPTGRLLVRAVENPDLVLPDADYLVTLDADSLVVPEYIATLVDVLEQPDNARLAVAQTPYSAVPDAADPIERVAGATTDIQYIGHQGFTHYGSTYWVGANAVIRMSALRDIEGTESERGFEIMRYIHDRTVIEDTESSVELLAKGWSLYNHPERLSYSATPPDYGSLVVQRQRWANGGLIILPKLLRYRWGQRRASLRWMIDSLVHLHYLVSIAGVNVALLALLLIPFSASFMTIWLPLTAAGYFFLYARDLSQSGYRYRDIVSVYALNLVLLPVNLAGVLKSVEQGLMRRKIPFARTPKIDGRTRAPRRYLVALLALVVAWVVGSVSDLTGGRAILGLFALANALILGYGIVAFIGWRALGQDLLGLSGISERLGRAEPATSEP